MPATEVGGAGGAAGGWGVGCRAAMVAGTDHRRERVANPSTKNTTYQTIDGAMADNPLV